MIALDYNTIIKYAWMDYDASRAIASIHDISALVSTNHVYKVILEDQSYVIAKLSYFGKYEHFVEDHSIINCLSNNLPYPFEDFLSRSLMKGDSLFVHRFKSNQIDTWVIFYRPVKMKNKLPRRLSEDQIIKMAQQFAHFHRACFVVRNTLPPSSKTLRSDVRDFMAHLETEDGQFEFRQYDHLIKEHCELFLQNSNILGLKEMDQIPVFIDWNIGNFSVGSTFKLYSRWDYDWFRISARMMDFYFFSRIVSDVGDRTLFSYNVDVMLEDRFIIFLKNYHKIYPLSSNEVLFLKEAYRFFLLNYVIRHGRYFFHELYAAKLQKEAYEIHLPSIAAFKPEYIAEILDL